MRLTKPGQYRDEHYLDGYSDTIHSVMTLNQAKSIGYNPIWRIDSVIFCRKNNGQGCLAINDKPFDNGELALIAQAVSIYHMLKKIELAEIVSCAGNASDGKKDAYATVANAKDAEIYQIKQLLAKIEREQRLY